MKARHAAIRWDEAGLPFSLDFDDYYYSKLDGLNEARYVFLEQNRLRERFKKLADGELLVIGETGFGTGLNFLAAWQLWRSQKTLASQPAGHLHFISLEQHPLTKKDITQAQALWPELAELAELLIQQYPDECQQTTYRFSFDNASVELTLMIGEAQKSLSELLASSHPNHQRAQWQGIDAWFLDGFTPAKNSEMWATELFTTLGQLSHSKTTLSTFTAASSVYKNLITAGFELEKKPGFGQKRELITGFKKTPTASVALDKHEHTFGHSSPYPAPWPVIAQYTPLPANSQVTVIGAGLAGCHTARALADAGYRVTLIEACDSICTQGSGNAQAILYAKLSSDGQTLSQFNYHSLIYAQRFYRKYWQGEPIGSGLGQGCGVIQLAYNESLVKTHKVIAENLPETFVKNLDRNQASTMAGTDINHPGLYFPDSGWLNPLGLCETLIEHPSITLRLNTSVEKIEYRDGSWQIDCVNAKSLSDAVVICNAVNAQQFSEADWLPTQSVRGQVSQLSNVNIDTLKTVVCAKGYIAPSFRGCYYFGATYTPKITNSSATENEYQLNLKHLKLASDKLSSEFASKESPKEAYGKVGFRCTTRDYLPIVGPVPLEKHTESIYQALRKNAKAKVHEANRYQPHLYVNVGHGSRGLCYTPISANLITSLISGKPPVLTQALRDALNPARFIIRELIKGQR